MEADVVVYRIEGREIVSYGRDTQETAAAFCRRPKWPAKLTDSFVGVDDWGHGEITCATPELSNWVGKKFSQFRAVAH